jgi:hypothetical protein
MALDAGRIKSGLARLGEAEPSVFGAGSHRFQLNRPLKEAEVVAFELGLQVQLPKD